MLWCDGVQVWGHNKIAFVYLSYLAMFIFFLQFLVLFSFSIAFSQCSYFLQHIYSFKSQTLLWWHKIVKFFEIWVKFDCFSSHSYLVLLLTSLCGGICLNIDMCLYVAMDVHSLLELMYMCVINILNFLSTYEMCRGKCTYNLNVRLSNILNAF